MLGVVMLVMMMVVMMIMVVMVVGGDNDGEIGHILTHIA